MKPAKRPPHRYYIKTDERPVKLGTLKSFGDTGIFRHDGREEVMEWKPIKTAPFQQIIWVRNSLMEKPVKATRGFADENGIVHPELTYCRSVYTPDDFFPTPAGKLVCPDEWAPVEED